MESINNSKRIYEAYQQIVALLGEKPIKIWNFWDNFNITIQNLNEKLISTDSLSHYPGP